MRITIIFKGTNIPVSGEYDNVNMTVKFDNSVGLALIDSINNDYIKFKGTTAPKSEGTITGLEFPIAGEITNGYITSGQVIAVGGTKEVQISANSNYTYPASVTVTGATASYNATTGKVTLSNPTGDVTITAACRRVYTITTTVTNGTYTGATTIVEGSTAAVTLSANSGYNLPVAATVVNATSIYDATTGIVTLSSPTGDVTITAACEAAVEYFTLTATQQAVVNIGQVGTVSSVPVFEYSVNGGVWSNYTLGTDITLTDGQNVKFRGDNTTINDTQGSNNIITVKINSGKASASGNIMTLLDKTGVSTTISTAYCFNGLFCNCSNLDDISGLSLPTTTLTYGCYGYMFNGCTGLTSIPAGLLPATSVHQYCYQYMFQGCTGLTSLPAGLLPATSVYAYSYYYMFQGCTSLTTLPANLLPANSLNTSCYSYMFNGCTGLTSIPAGFLPATTLATGCYTSMFFGCTGLTSIPSNLLPATTLKARCYSSMFGMCTGLTTLPSGLLPATALEQACYNNMFSNCTNLVSIPAGFLPATTLATNCYETMFQWCSNLVTLPTNLLPANTLTRNCYSSMFSQCKKLVTLPNLSHIIELSESSLEGMFAADSLIKMSETQTGEYTNAFTFGVTPSATTAGYMFNVTGGTFTGTPTAQTYYTSNTIV